MAKLVFTALSWPSCEDSEEFCSPNCSLCWSSEANCDWTGSEFSSSCVSFLCFLRHVMRRVTARQTAIRTATKTKKYMAVSASLLKPGSMDSEPAP